MTLEDVAGRSDVALSYAGEDREYVERVATVLQGNGISVFFDKFEAAWTLGTDLSDRLRDVYGNARFFCVLFLSKHYAAKAWTQFELREVQARAFAQREEYMLPARFDDTEMALINPSVAYVDLRTLTAEQFAVLVLDKIRYRRRQRRRRRRGQIACYLATALATFAGLKAYDLSGGSPPAWLSRDFAPAIHELVITADSLKQASVEYLWAIPDDKAGLKSQVEDLAKAVTQYNCAYEHLKTNKRYFSEEVSTLQPALRDVVDVVSNDVKERLTPSYPVPRVADDKSVMRQHHDLHGSWTAESTRLEPVVWSLRAGMNVLEHAAVRATGATEPDCRALLAR